MRTPVDFGVRPEAAGPWLALGCALDRLADEGRRTPCQVDPGPLFIPSDRSEAAEACRLGCPALRQCRVFAEANGERFGVWGGIDRTGKRSAA